MTETTTRSRREVRREIQSIVWAAGECRACASRRHEPGLDTFTGPHNEGCRKLQKLSLEMPGKAMAWQRALSRLAVADREEPDLKWWAEGPPAPRYNPARTWTDADLWMLRQTGGGTNPRTGQVDGLSIRRLSEVTGLTEYRIRKRLCAYTRSATA